MESLLTWLGESDRVDFKRFFEYLEQETAAYLDLLKTER